MADEVKPRPLHSKVRPEDIIVSPWYGMPHRFVVLQPEKLKEDDTIPGETVYQMVSKRGRIIKKETDWHISTLATMRAKELWPDLE